MLFEAAEQHDWKIDIPQSRVVVVRIVHIRQAEKFLSLQVHCSLVFVSITISRNGGIFSSSHNSIKRKFVDGSDSQMDSI